MSERGDRAARAGAPETPPWTEAAGEEFAPAPWPTSARPVERDEVEQHELRRRIERVLRFRRAADGGHRV